MIKENDEKLMKKQLTKYTHSMISDFIENFRYNVANSFYEYHKNNTDLNKKNKDYQKGFKTCSDLILNTLKKSEKDAKEKITRIINKEDVK